MPTKAPYARVRCPVSDFALTAPPSPKTKDFDRST